MWGPHTWNLLRAPKSLSPQITKSAPDHQILVLARQRLVLVTVKRFVDDYFSSSLTKLTLICLSNFRETSNRTPRFLTTDLQKGAKFPKSERTWDSEFPNQITLVLISFKFKKNADIHSLTSCRQFSRDVIVLLSCFRKVRYTWVSSAKQWKETPCL